MAHQPAHDKLTTQAVANLCQAQMVVQAKVQAKDLDHKEKQHWPGCLKIFSVATLEHLQTVQETDPHARGIVAFIKFGIKLLNCHIGDQAGANAVDPTQAITDAAYSCAFVLYWRWRVVRLKEQFPTAGYSLKKHFLTREMFLDILTLTQSRILLALLYRENYPEFKVHGPNISSRFSEYVFQYARMHEKNSPRFDVAGFRRHIKHFMLQIQLAAAGKIEMPPSKRGVPNSVKQPNKSQCAAPAGWHLNDEQMQQAIDRGIAECIHTFLHDLGCTECLDMDLSNPDHFFADPVKHFPDGDIYNAGVDQDDEWFRASSYRSADSMREDSDWNSGDGDDADKDSPDTSGETHDIAAQWSEMISQQGLVDPDAVEPNQSALDLLRSLHKPIRDFNESVERAKADRTFGRMEMQAFRDIGMNEKDATVWDYISGDDDVVVMERTTDSNGVITDSLIHANVVDTAILKDPPAARKRKIDGIDLQNKDPRRRVPCSLPKGCVWLRKYKEVTEIRTALPSYQNNRRGRHAQKYWKLPLETNEPLQW